MPELRNPLIFILGVILARATGCVTNGFADRNFNGHVTRIRTRPLTIGKISVREARATFIVLIALSFGLALLISAATA